MRFELNLTEKQAIALIELGFTEVEQQLSDYHKAINIMTNKLLSIGSIIRFFEDDGNITDSKCDILRNLCEDIVTPETKKYFFSKSPLLCIWLDSIQINNNTVQKNIEYDNSRIISSMLDNYRKLCELYNELKENKSNLP